VECLDYRPPYYVAPEVLANDCTRVAGGWADPEDVTLVSEELAALGVELDATGRPLHPYGRTGLAGRGALGRWGPNVMVVAVVTRAVAGASSFEILLGASETSEVLVLSGDFVRSREVAEAAVARLIEGTAGRHLDLHSEVLSEGYDYDSRRTDHAWVVTSVRHVHVADGGVRDFFRAGPGIESLSWYPLDAATINRIPAPSARHVRAAVRALGDAGQLTEAAVSAVLAATG
jgi:ADP-ribose pyrophosphatase